MILYNPKYGNRFTTHIEEYDINWLSTSKIVVKYNLSASTFFLNVIERLILTPSFRKKRNVESLHGNN